MEGAPPARDRLTVNCEVKRLTLPDAAQAVKTQVESGDFIEFSPPSRKGEIRRIFQDREEVGLSPARLFNPRCF